MIRLLLVCFVASLTLLACKGKRSPDKDKYCNTLTSEAYDYDDAGDAPDTCLRITREQKGKENVTVYCCKK